MLRASHAISQAAAKSRTRQAMAADRDRISYILYYIMEDKNAPGQGQEPMTVATTALYDTLGVAPRASAHEIKSAYRRLARQYHPDLNSQIGAQQRLNEINLAYEILSDPERRRQYDLSGLRRS